MEEILIDLNNYSKDDSIFYRSAARGIIKIDDKYLLIQSKVNGEYKFPGGGMKKDETILETLCREVLEETGRVVIKESATLFLKVKEKRKDSSRINSTLLMESYYYICEVSEQIRPRKLDQYEMERDYQVELKTLEEALKVNNSLKQIDLYPWIIRDNKVMELLLEKNK